MHTPSNEALSLNLRERLQATLQAIEAFRSGRAVLIADDGTRENEVDFVFAAAHATPELVNFALEHCRGLVCVSVGPKRANELGLMSAPRIPAGFAHTGFTCSLDAREGITSGISAKDRARTIALMASPEAGIQDFVSPGHVFPVTADAQGLTRRAGHTEAVLELCRLSGLAEAGVMCEILARDGEALPVDAIKSLGSASVFADLPLISTADLLWCRLLFGQTVARSNETECGFARDNRLTARPQKACFEDSQWRSWTRLHPDSLAPFTVPYALHVRKGLSAVSPGQVRIEHIGAAPGLSCDNGVTQEAAQAVISLFLPAGSQTHLPSTLSSFANLGDKEGLSQVPVAVKRSMTSFFLLDSLAHAAEFLDLGTLPDRGAPQMRLRAEAGADSFTLFFLGALPSPDDKIFLKEVLKLRSGFSRDRSRDETGSV